MGWFRRETKPETVVATLVEMGAPETTSREIVDALLASGLTAGEAKVWVADPDRCLDDARRLTGCSPERAAVIAGIARTIRERVGNDQDVCYVGQMVLPGSEDRRIVDRLLDGEEQAVRDELARGELDPKRLLEEQPLHLTGW